MSNDTKITTYPQVSLSVWVSRHDELQKKYLSITGQDLVIHDFFNKLLNITIVTRFKKNFLGFHSIK